MNENFNGTSDLLPGPEILIPKKNVAFDSQLLTTLMACGRKTNFNFNLHLVAISGKSVSLEMGSIVHCFLENYYKSIINGIKKSEAEGFAFTAALQYIESPEVKNSSEEDRQWALQTCRDYLEFYRNDSWVPLEIEVVKGRVLYEDDEIRVLWKAKFDSIFDTNQGIFAADHKTMKQRRDTISLNNQFMGQTILTDQRKMYVNKIGFQKSLKPEERFSRPTINYTRARLAEWQGETLPYYARVYLNYAESGYWPPNHTQCENKYGNCNFLPVCEADPDVREEILGQSFVAGDPWDILND